MRNKCRTTVVAVLLCTLVLGLAKGKEHHRALHGSQKPVAVADGRLKSTDGKIYFVVRALRSPSLFRPCWTMMDIPSLVFLKNVALIALSMHLLYPSCNEASSQ